MFKEIADTIKSLAQPVLQLPSFVVNDKPYDLILLMISQYHTSQDTDRYMRFVETDDFIFILYKDLFKDHKELVIYDNLLYKGSIKQISLVDYDTATNSRDVLAPLGMYFTLSLNSSIFLKAKNTLYFYHKTKGLDFVFTEARTYIFIDVALSIFSDTDELRESIFKILKMYVETVKGPEFTMKDVDSLIDIIKHNGIYNLLDCSMIASIADEI